MMKFYLLDDDESVLMMLKMIIRQRNLGTIIGSATDGRDALEDLRDQNPDIMIVDLLMPRMDGIKFVKQACKTAPDTKYIMLSQVSSKDMIAGAYEAGVEFFIQKPINAIEVENVIKRVAAAIRQPASIRQAAAEEILPEESESEAVTDREAAERAARQVLQQLGISGERGNADVMRIVGYLLKEELVLGEVTLTDVCAGFSDVPKSMEQRIRRCLASALNNMAQIGIEDYGNDVFQEFAGRLFGYEQVRKEMNYVLGKSERHGTVKARNFLNALAAYSLDAAEKNRR